MQGTDSRIPTDVMILENDTLLKPHQGGHFHCYKCSIPTSHDQSCIFTVIKHSIPEGGQQSNPLTKDLAAIKLALREGKEGKYHGVLMFLLIDMMVILWYCLKLKF